MDCLETWTKVADEFARHVHDRWDWYKLSKPSSMWCRSIVGIVARKGRGRLCIVESRWAASSSSPVSLAWLELMPVTTTTTMTQWTKICRSCDEPSGHVAWNMENGGQTLCQTNEKRENVTGSQSVDILDIKVGVLPRSLIHSIYSDERYSKGNIRWVRIRIRMKSIARWMWWKIPSRRQLAPALHQWIRRGLHVWSRQAIYHLSLDINFFKRC